MGIDRDFDRLRDDSDELEPRRAGFPPERTSEVAQPVAAPAPAVPRHFRETVGPKASFSAEEFERWRQEKIPALPECKIVDGVCVTCRAATTKEREASKPIGLAGDSATRKDAPIYEGFVCYFPNAMANVAKLSKHGNDKHNPGQTLRWSFNLSNDHGNCIVRHQASDPEAVDESYNDPEILHATAVAWRAMAQLETILLKKYPELTPGKNVVGFER